MPATLESRGRVTGYVEAVRGELDDLPPETVEELTGGLAADLTEAMAAPQDLAKTPVEMFGLPKTYAAELRSAAGLRERKGFRWPTGRSGVFAREVFRALELVREDIRHQFGAVLAGQRWFLPVQDFLRALHPSWWAFRAFLAYWYLSQLGSQRIVEPIGKDLGLPHSPLTWLAMIVLLVVSVELGRRRRPAIVGAVIVVLNLWLVTAVLLVLPTSLYWAW